MRLQNLTITDRELEHCVALAILDHNGEQNPKSLEVPLDRWRNAAAGLDPRVDDPQQVLLTFCLHLLLSIPFKRDSLFLPCRR